MNRAFLSRPAAAALIALAPLGFSAAAGAQDLAGCPSAAITQRFEDFGRTGRMPLSLGRWLMDRKAQYIEPYQAFDNVYYVGICWVSAWLIKTNEGAILIDTLHDPFADQLIENIRRVGVDPKDIKYVFITHGHFDHAGGAYKLRPLTAAQFLMTQTGWDEAEQSSRETQGTARAWTMIPKGRVLQDGEAITLGEQTVRAHATPGHTFGTASYTFDVFDQGRKIRAVTVGGLGLNAIESARQVEAYIASVDHLASLIQSEGVQAHLTTHPFATGLTEAKDRLKTRQPGTPHPLVDPSAFAGQLQQLRAGAVERLQQEKAAGR